MAFMNSEGQWMGTFADCSKKVQGRLNAQIAQKGWHKKDFIGSPHEQTAFKDAVARTYMTWQLTQSHVAKRVHACMNLKALLDMSQRQQKGVVPPTIRHQFETGTVPSDIVFLNFTRYPSTPEPLVILGRKDKQVLALRVRIPMHFIQMLKDTSHLVPRRRQSSTPRGEYETRNYCLWADYADHPYLSADLLTDGEFAKEWLEAQAPLFRYLSNVLKLWDFESYRNMTTHPWLDNLIVNRAVSLGQKIVPGRQPSSEDVPLHTVAGIWFGLAINLLQQKPGNPHRDPADARNSLTCVIPWGEWKGGDLLFWEIQKQVQVSEGEVIFFRSRALTHNVSPLQEGGTRNIVDLYSHQNVLDVDKKRRERKRKRSEN